MNNYPTNYNHGELWEYSFNGKVYQGRIKNIARVFSGAVLAFFEEGRGFPITKYGKWRKISEENNEKKKDFFIVKQFGQEIKRIYKEDIEVPLIENEPSKNITESSAQPQSIKDIVLKPISQWSDEERLKMEITFNQLEGSFVYKTNEEIRKIIGWR